MDAFAQVAKKRQEQLAIHKDVMDSLPEDPPRGSYYWWARLCRENTGSAICDSGYAYGYQYMRSVRPEDGSHFHLNMWNGKPEGWTINLIKYLETNFDASCDVSAAIQEVLDWVGLWLYPRENWCGIIGDFPEDLEKLRACITKRSDDTLILHKKAGIARVVADALVDLHYTSDLRSWQQKLSNEEYIQQALAEFPDKAMKLLYENEIGKAEGGDVYDDPGTFYTYNQENELSQDFMVDLWLSDNTGDLHAVIRTHNGCDARGGFSEPVVARLYDVDYLYDWRSTGSCRFCNEDFWSAYDYAQKVEKSDGPDLDAESIRAYFDHQAQMEDGQLVFLENTPELKMDPGHARAILAYHDKIVEEEPDIEEVEYPIVMFCYDEDGQRHCVMDDEAQGSAPDDMVDGLWCPHCNQYGVHFWTSVYGF